MKSVGYITTSVVNYQRWPQSMQGLTIREYAKKRGLEVGLSSTEHKKGVVALFDTIAKLERGDNLVLFTMHQLPKDIRGKVMNRLLDEGITIHAAYEDEQLCNATDRERWYDLFRLTEVIDGCD